jgi:TRAP-type mannitol/chloroaromatic compound transport system permease large subunit
VAVLFAAYIIIRCKLNPILAPDYAVASVPFKEKVNVVVKQILPIGIVIFAVIGVIFLGIATPTEAAALGALACYILAALYRKFNWRMIKESAKSTIQISVMVLMIMTASLSFSRILVTSGSIAGLVNLSTAGNVPGMVIVVATQFVVVFLGCFMDPASIVMITVPMFFPMIQALGYNMLWYAILLLINVQLGLITPPFGLDVYTMKALSPPDISLGAVFRASMPFLAIGFLLMVIIFIYPPLVTWLPSIVR